MNRRFKLALFVGLVVFILLTQVAATGTATALAIAAAVGIIAPFILKFVPAAGRYMLAITALVSVVIAIAAELISGDVNLSNLDVTKIGELCIATFGVTQAVFAYFKDHPLGPLAVK
jgi:O-antigen ligase